MEADLKIIQIVPSLALESAGPSYSVPALCGGLAQSGCGVSLHCVGNIPNKKFIFPVVSHPLSTFPSSRFCRSPEMVSRMMESAEGVDIIHNNSFWQPPNVYPLYVIKKLRSEGKKVPKLVNSPRGVFAPWALKRHVWRKRIFGLFFGQYDAMRATDMWHATSEKEYEEIRAQGYRQPVAIVPIGMDVPVVASSKLKGLGVDVGGDVSKLQLTTNNQQPTIKTLAFFGRIHKVKAIDSMLLAWSKIAQQFLDWRVVIAGPDCGDKGRLEQIIAEGVIPRVEFVGELRGQAKYEFLGAADLYCLPSKTENFGVTLAEALACGVPSIASMGTPWSGLETERCGRWVKNDPDSLAGAFAELMSLPDEELRRMGERGREWIKRDFSWEGIGAKMRAAYEWVLDPEHLKRPEWVRIYK